MRYYYSTHTFIRLFVLGVPEGWQVALYDIDKQQWIDNTAWVEDTLLRFEGHGAGKGSDCHRKAIVGM